MTATEAARSFSEVLDRVASGEIIEVTRSGAPVAVIGPPRERSLSAERFRELIASAPRPDEAFAAELAAARDSAADIWAELSNRGQPIGAHDLWIAATAIAHGLGVATRNGAHFTRIEGLRVVATLA